MERGNPNEIGDTLKAIKSFEMKLKIITNRSVKVYKPLNFEKIIALQSILYHKGFEIIKTENLYEFDGKRVFSLGQGE